MAPKDIPCHVIDDEADVAEIGLAENVQREASRTLRSTVPW